MQSREMIKYDCIQKKKRLDLLARGWYRLFVVSPQH